VKSSLSIDRISNEEVPLYGLLEIDLNVTGNFENPFSPDQVDVAATIETPTGRMVQTPAFYH